MKKAKTILIVFLSILITIAGQTCIATQPNSPGTTESQGKISASKVTPKFSGNSVKDASTSSKKQKIQSKSVNEKEATEEEISKISYYSDSEIPTYDSVTGQPLVDTKRKVYSYKYTSSEFEDYINYLKKIGFEKLGGVEEYNGYIESYTRNSKYEMVMFTYPKDFVREEAKHIYIQYIVGSPLK